MTGIYVIKNLVNSKIYIGSCKDFRKRKNNHLSKLRMNDHHSIKLQRGYNKYGEQNFIFELIEETSQEDTLIREQYWIDLFKPDYNCAKFVGGHNRKSTSEETRAKISASKKNKREVYKFDLDCNLLEKFESLSNATKSVGKNNISHILDCCKENRGTAYGFRWSYSDKIRIKDKYQTKKEQNIIYEN